MIVPSKTSLFFLSALTGFLQPVHGVDLTFASEANCTGVALYGRPNITLSECYDLTSHEESARSVILSNIASHEVVNFFSDAKCQHHIEGVTSDECYTPSNVQINSFKVGNLAATKDLAVQTETLQLSSYRDRAQNSPYAVELRFPHGFVGITLRTSAIGLSLGAAAAGCYQVKTGDPIAIVGCVASALTALMSAIGSKELAKKGTDFLARAGAKLGMFLDVKRATIDEITSDFMHDTYSGNGSTHVGFTTRNTTRGLQTSPVYEVEFPDGKYHFSSYLSSDGDMIQNMRPAEESAHIHRRASYGYGDVSFVKGGVDFRICPRNQAYWGNPNIGWSEDPATNYQFLYKDINCLASGSQLASASNIQVDMYSANSVILAQVQLSFDSGTFTEPPQCVGSIANINSACIQ